jgi:hypothetical protein
MVIATYDPLIGLDVIKISSQYEKGSLEFLLIYFLEISRELVLIPIYGMETGILSHFTNKLIVVEVVPSDPLTSLEVLTIL